MLRTVDLVTNSIVLPLIIWSWWMKFQMTRWCNQRHVVDVSDARGSLELLSICNCYLPIKSICTFVEMNISHVLIYRERCQPQTVVQPKTLRESIPRLFNVGGTITTTHCAPACSQVLPVKPQGVWTRSVEAWAAGVTWPPTAPNLEFRRWGSSGPSSLMTPDINIVVRNLIWVCTVVPKCDRWLKERLP